MQKLVSKYGLAAHLALLTVAPLVLLPFFGVENTATVLLWMSAFGFVWVLMEPSRRSGEMSVDAKKRVNEAVCRDPLFWFSIILVLYVAVAALNGGIGLAYDSERQEWFVKDPFLSFLPGCVEHAGYFLFSVVVALSVVFQGLRHAVGRLARASFVLVSSVVSACAVCLMVVASTYGHPGVVSLMTCSTLAASYFGTAFGLQLLCGLVAFVDAVDNDWIMVEPIAGLGIVGNAVGLVMFAPLHTIAVFAIAYLVLVIVSMFILRSRCSGASSFRFFLAVVVSLIAPALCLLSTTAVPAIGAKLALIKACEVFPTGYFETRDALSSIALRAWKGSPWLGTGLDSFPFDIRFMAVAADWDVVSASQKTTLSGWWQMLAEGGVIGCAFLAVTVGMLIWTYVARIIRSWSTVRLTAEHFVGPVLLLALVAVSFVDCSLTRPEVLMLAGALLALSCGAFPAGTRVTKVEKEV